MFIMSGAGITTNGLRPNHFNAAVYHALGHPGPGQNICHSISFDLMQTWMDEIRTNSPVIAVDLTALADAVYCGNPLPLAVTTAIANIAAGITVANLNALLVFLYNALPNLRIGDASWNQGIGEHFDPGEWVHYDATGTIDSSVNGPGNSGWLGTLAPPAAPLASTFYLCCAEDSTRIDLVHQINNATTPMEVISNAGFLTGGAPIDFVQSSDNNGFNMPAQMLQAGDPVFYFDIPTGTWLQI